jgi:hypothetical protein
MAKEWIDNLAQEIKQKNHDAAEEHGRAEHYAGVVSVLGKEFFVSLTVCLKEDVDALRSRLQGDTTSCDTEVQTVKADEVKITRARFPWIDAKLMHRDDTIVLEYAKGPGAKGPGEEADLAADRKSRIFAFQVAPDESVFVQDGFVEPPRQHRTPDELARHIVEILFGV